MIVNGLFTLTKENNSSEMERTVEERSVYFTSVDGTNFHDTRGLMWRDG